MTRDTPPAEHKIRPDLPLADNNARIQQKNSSQSRFGSANGKQELNRVWATLEIPVLLATIWAYVIAAKPASRTAAWLFVPYGLWAGFATVLTAALWLLNR